MKLQELCEGSWLLPDTEDKVKKLYYLLQEPIPVDDGQKADLLHRLLGDDDLADDIYVVSKRNAKEFDPKDIRPVIIKHLPRILDTSRWFRQPDEDTQFYINLLLKKYVPASKR